MFLKKVITAALLLLICTLAAGCSQAAMGEKEQQNVGTEAADMIEPDVTVMENNEHQLVFNISMEDFIDSYNSAYNRDQGKSFMPPSHEWSFYNAMAVHSDNETIRYNFSEDESVRAVPVISIFVPAADDRVQQIMLSYDDHSYSIPTYEMYEEMCFYTLKVMFPELSDDKLTELYTRLNVLADENITDVPYSSGAVPCELYHRGGIGVYTYFCIGEEIRFCVIPVTQELLESLADKGTVINEIDP